MHKNSQENGLASSVSICVWKYVHDKLFYAYCINCFIIFLIDSSKQPCEVIIIIIPI